MKKSHLFSFLLSATLSFFVINYGIDEKSIYPRQSGALEALRQWNFERSYPFEKLPNNTFYRAFEKKQLIKKSATVKLDEKWEPIGPQNFGGRTISLAINLYNPNTIYAGSASGGLWVTHSAGIGEKAWKRISTGFPVLGVGAIALDYSDTNIIYIGTGEVYNYAMAEGGVAVRETRGSYGMGILKSTDAGMTWRKSLDWSYQQQRGVLSLKINPMNSKTIYAGTTEGLYKSINAGESWEKIFDTLMVTDIIINSADTNKLIAACGNMESPGNGIYRTSDAGMNWERLENGLPSQYGGKAVFSTIPSNPDLIYASIGNGYWSGAGTWLCKTADFGDSWIVVNTKDYATYQGWFAHLVVLHRDNPDLLLTAGVDVYKSTDGGVNLSKRSNWAAWYFGRPPLGGPEGPSDYSHADHHVYVLHPTNPEIVYFGNDGGIFRTTDFGETFEGLNGGYQTQQFYNGFTASFTDSNWAVGGMQDNATAIYDGQLAWIRAIGGDGSWAAIDQKDNSTIYGSWQRLNIQRSTNRGASWNYIAPPGGGITSFIAPYAVAYDNPDIIYAARSVVYKSSNKGKNWSSTNGGNAISDNPPIAIDVARTNSKYVYVATAPVNSRAGIYRTKNGGVNWEEVTGSLPDRYPMDIRVAPENEEMVVVCFSGYGTSHVFKSYDAGDNWIDISAGLPDVPVNSVAIHPNSSDMIFAGTDLGVFISTDAGKNWSDMSEGLPQAVIIKSLQITESNNVIKAATHGNGVYEFQLPNIPSGVKEDETSPKNFTLYQNYPNPFNPATTIKYRISSSISGYSSVVQIDVYNALGEKVAALVNEHKTPGFYETVFNAVHLPSGVYYYKLTKDNRSEVRKMILLK